MSIALLLLQAQTPEMPEFLKQLGIATAETLAIVAVAVLIAMLLLRLLTMWWFGVTTVINRLDQVINLNSAVVQVRIRRESRVRSGVFQPIAKNVFQQPAPTLTQTQLRCS